jgi:hypothetical protein
VGIEAGIPNSVIHAVHYAGHASGSFAKQAVEATAVIARHDFARVGRAHLGDGIGQSDAGIQEGQTPIELERRKTVGRKIDLASDAGNGSACGSLA